jgi:hypothetical protein
MTDKKVAVLIDGRAYLVPPGVAPESMLPAGYSFRGSGGTAADQPLKMADTKHSSTSRPTVKATIAENLKAGVRDGSLISTRVASGQIGSARFAALIATGKLQVHTVHGRRYVSREALHGLLRAERLERDEASPQAGRRRRRNPPSWLSGGGAA